MGRAEARGLCSRQNCTALNPREPECKSIDSFHPYRYTLRYPYYSVHRRRRRGRRRGRRRSRRHRRRRGVTFS